jgi:hypothetical protein
MDQKEFASLGGKQTVLKYGREHMVKLGKKGAQALKDKYGDDYFKRIKRGEKPSED